MILYNDIDEKVCAWTEELLRAGLIPPGKVECKSITEYKPDELKQYTQVHFCSGIQGWSLALQLAGWPTDRPVWTGSMPCQPFSSAGKGLGTADERHLWPVFAELIRQCKPATVFGEQVASKAGREWLAGVFADLEGMGYSRAGADLCAASVGAPHIRQRLWWVADSTSSFGSQQQREQGSRPRRKAGPQNATEHSGPYFGVADSSTARLQRGAGIEQLERHGEIGGLGNPNDEGSQGRFGQELRECSHEQTAGPGGSSFWSNAILIPCRDGKARRVPKSESILQRVVDGLPYGVDTGGPEGAYPLCGKVAGRVALLKGYGNAIAPQVAAEFISAYLEVTQ